MIEMIDAFCFCHSIAKPCSWPTMCGIRVLVLLCLAKIGHGSGCLFYNPLPWNVDADKLRSAELCDLLKPSSILPEVTSEEDILAVVDQLSEHVKEHDAQMEDGQRVVEIWTNHHYLLGKWNEHGWLENGSWFNVANGYTKNEFLNNHPVITEDLRTVKCGFCCIRLRANLETRHYDIFVQVCNFWYTTNRNLIACFATNNTLSSPGRICQIKKPTTANTTTEPPPTTTATTTTIEPPPTTTATTEPPPTITATTTTTTATTTTTTTTTGSPPTTTAASTATMLTRGKPFESKTAAAKTEASVLATATATIFCFVLCGFISVDQVSLSW